VERDRLVIGGIASRSIVVEQIGNVARICEIDYRKVARLEGET